MKSAFLVLHYMNYDITTRCVNKLNELFPESVILIVDNGSPNHSGKCLEDKYRFKNNIYTLLLKENKGFAEGNNIGYKYLKSKFNLDYMIIINSDILITDDYFLNKIETSYSIYKFDILGPDIISLPKGIHQNPTHKNLITIDEAQSIVNNIMSFDKHILLNYWKHYFAMKVKKVRKDSTKYAKKAKKNVALHGSCYILSKKFIKSRDRLFFPHTFMYFEEEFVFYESLRDRKNIIYDPSIKVFHYEDSSTNFLFRKNKLKKLKFKHYEMIKSINSYIDYLNASGNEERQKFN